MKNIKKNFIRIIIFLFFVLGVITISTIIKYLSITSPDKIPEIKFELPQKKNFTICFPIELTAEIALDWKTKPKKIVIALPEGLQEYSAPEFKISKISWGKWIWKIKVYVQAYIPGNYQKISGNASFISQNSKQLEALIRLPDLNISPFGLKNNTTLKIAEKIEKKSNKKLWILITLIFAIIIAIIVIVLYLKNKKRITPQLPSWCITLDKIRNLRISHEKGLISVIESVSALCDIIRDYLEERFNINAPNMTTYEFLNNLKKNQSPLNSEQKNFLSNFMESADLAKFAKIPLSSDTLEKAISDAEKLVKETIPEKQKEGEKNAF